MRSVGILGGTFDPVHNGHIKVAETALVDAHLDEVWFMPVNIPPHKKPAQAPGTDRYRMLQLALAGQRALHLADLELRTPGDSYTINTIRTLQEHNSNTCFNWIIGSDLLPHLTKWHEINVLITMISFLVMNRVGVKTDDSFLPENIREKLIHLHMPAIAVSSTGIRRRIRDGESVKHLVSPSVLDYMRRKKLYA